jgi:hypothetical protein
LSAIKITNDISLSKAISVTVSENYITALEFINSNPDYSLVKFREVVSEVVKLIASKNGMIFENEKLCDNIRELLDSQLIYFPLYENLHKVRKLGNKGAHNSISPDIQDGKEFRKTRKKSLIENASQARKIIVSIFKDIYFILKNEQLENGIEFSPIGQQELREILYDANLMVDPKLKIKAGIICETIMFDHFFEVGPNYLSNHRAHYYQLLKNAINFYNASCEISANIEINNPNKYEDIEPIIQKHADTEALYRFASLTIDEPSESELYQKAVSRLKASGDRGYGPAQALYGTILYGNGEFSESYKYLELGAKKEVPLALNQLFLIFSDGMSREIDYEKAMFFLNQAIDLGNPDAFAYLGIANYEGKVVPKNIEKGRGLLQKSVEMGSVFGKIELESRSSMIEKDVDDFKSLLREQHINFLEGFLNPNKFGFKVGRNDKCPCDSGKKYKKCCGKNS